MAEIDLKPGWLKRDTLAAAVSVAWDELRQRKRAMDEAQVIFEKAEDAWQQACIELERLETEQQR